MNLIPNAVARYAEIYWVQLKNNWVREAVYRSNFITQLFVDLIWIAVEASLFTVIYAHVPTLAGWNVHQVYFFLGMFFASDALFSTFFARNMWRFSDLVNRGELDLFLTKPANALFLILTRWISISSLLNFVFGVGIMAWFGERAGFAGGIQWLNVAFWITFGLLAQLVLRFAFSIWVFWTERSWAMTRLYYQFFAIATKPDTLYPVLMRYTLLTALPFAFIGSVPARAVLYGLSATEYVWISGSMLGLLALDWLLWRRGLRRYQSASS